MKKLFVMVIVAGAIFLSITHFELFANTQVNETQVLALLDEGTVVISEGQIYNLADMREFYDNARLNVDSEIHLIIDPYTDHMQRYLLQLVEGRILLFSFTGEGHETVSEYARLFRIYRGQEIHYVLECFEHNEHVLFGHGTS